MGMGMGRNGKTVDGNGNNPSSHGKNSHGLFVVVDLL